MQTLLGMNILMFVLSVYAVTVALWVLFGEIFRLIRESQEVRTEGKHRKPLFSTVKAGVLSK